MSGKERACSLSHFETPDPGIPPYDKLFRGPGLRICGSVTEISTIPPARDTKFEILGIGGLPTYDIYGSKGL